jgi:hypothetical protein
VEKFLEIVGEGPSQIVNIGAGYDTTSLNLMERNLTELCFFEIDFPDLIMKKANLLLKSREIRSVVKCDNTILEYKTSYGYDLGQLKLIGNDLHSSSNLLASLSGAGVDPSLPTLVITECVLVCTYILAHPHPAATTLPIHLINTLIFFTSDMDKVSTVSLVRDVVSYFSASPAADGADAPSPAGNMAWISYDMVNPNDAFGKMMR